MSRLVESRSASAAEPAKLMLAPSRWLEPLSGVPIAQTGGVVVGGDGDVDAGLGGVAGRVGHAEGEHVAARGEEDGAGDRAVAVDLNVERHAGVEAAGPLDDQVADVVLGVADDGHKVHFVVRVEHAVGVRRGDLSGGCVGGVDRQRDGSGCGVAARVDHFHRDLDVAGGEVCVAGGGAVFSGGRGLTQDVAVGSPGDLQLGAGVVGIGDGAGQGEGVALALGVSSCVRGDARGGGDVDGIILAGWARLTLVAAGDEHHGNRSRKQKRRSAHGSSTG